MIFLTYFLNFLIKNSLSIHFLVISALYFLFIKFLINAQRIIYKLKPNFKRKYTNLF